MADQEDDLLLSMEEVVADQGITSCELCGCRIAVDSYALQISSAPFFCRDCGTMLLAED